MDNEPTALTATETAFRVDVEEIEGEEGIRLSWGDDPLDFIWQNKSQSLDLFDKLGRIIP